MPIAEPGFDNPGSCYVSPPRIFPMPMNKFLFDHQLAAMKADRAGSLEERKQAFELMGKRAKRMADWRKTNGLSDTGWPTDERPVSGKG